MEFEWDPQKEAANVAKHGVSFEEAATVFGDPLGRIVTDPRHSAAEYRYVLMGRSQNNRLLAVMFTDCASVIRIISARLVTRSERRDYEENAE
ncbi:MAG: BrnT family toxin [Acidobacteriia bacterium]|nr:BrnT family toxin [Terriglobia bacterium]